MPRQFIPYLRWPIALMIAIVPILAIYLWPMSWWFDVRVVHVNDAKFGAPITMLVDRDVRRPFLGVYYVAVHRWGTNGAYAWCRAQGGPWPYREGAVYPVPLTLEWWTEGEPTCKNLPVGQYQVTTRWVNVGNALPLPDKSVTAVSNIFTVTP